MARDTTGKAAKSGGAYRHTPEHKVRLRDLGDMDRRTLAAKKAQHLLAGILSDLGGEDRVSVAERQLATRAAVLCSIAADLEVRWLTGETIDHSHYQSTVNTLRRFLCSLGLARRMRDVSPATDLQSYIREREFDATADDEEADASDEVAA